MSEKRSLCACVWTIVRFFLLPPPPSPLHICPSFQPVIWLGLPCVWKVRPHYFPLFSCTNQYGGDTGQWGGGKKSQVSTLSAYLGILRRCSPCKPCSPDFVDVPWNLANLIPVAVKLQPLVLGSQFCEFTNTGPCALFLCFFSFEQELCRGLCFSLTFCGSIAVGILPCLSCSLGILGENPKWSIFVKGTEVS